MPTAAVDAAALRRLLIVACIVVATETTLLAVITPLLPHYADEFGLSKAGLGFLAATYPLGILVASLPSGVMVARFGPRATMLTALGLLAFACVAFILARSAGVLMLARFTQGAAGSIIWAAGFAWVIDASPPAGRGKLIGLLISAAVAGGLIGPPLGALGAAIGPSVLFGAALVLSGALALVTWTLPAPVHEATSGFGAMRGALRQWPVLLPAWLVVLAGVNFGVITVLGVIRLDAIGAGALGIAVVFCLTSLVEMGLNPFVGGVADRRGAFVPIRIGLAGVAAVLCVFALPSTYLFQGVLVLAALCTSATFWTPSMSLLSEEAGRAGLQQGMAFAVANVAWAVGNGIGAYGSGALAGAVSEGAAALLAAALAAASLAAVLATRTRPAIAA